MRKAFIDALIELSETDKDIWLLTADMGFGLMEPFAEKFPKQYINVGVAEQNMIGIAAGLALEGKKVFCYSIANFPTMRCLEQIRNDVCYHNLPVCIVSGGAGLWYGALGMTHHAVEDIAVMRCLPNMAVVSPANAKETGLAVKAIVERGQPCYLRMSRTSGNVLPPDDLFIATGIYDYKLGKSSLILRGTDVTIMAIGGQMIDNSIIAANKIRNEKLSVRVVSMRSVKPLCIESIENAAWYTRAIITVEEHSRIGGLGSAVAEVLAGMREHAPLVRLGTADCYPTTAMSYEELLKANHLDVDGIVKEVLDAFS